MSKRTLLAMGCAAILAASASFAGEKAKPACCAKKPATTQTTTAEKLRCSLTGEVVDKCCCVEREGKLHCTLADKDVAECCCGPAREDAKKAK